MPAGISRSQVEAIADLANLQLDDAELDLFARQLGDILDHVTQVQRIDTTGVSSTTQVLTRPVSARDDVVMASLDRVDALANAPDGHPDAGLFKVPRVIG